MKIIVKNKKEKDQLIKLSRYLHNFRVYMDHNGKYTKIYLGEGKNNARDRFKKMKNGDLYFLDNDFPLMSYLMHLYSTPEEIEINNENN